MIYCLYESEILHLLLALHNMPPWTFYNDVAVHSLGNFFLRQQKSQISLRYAFKPVHCCKLKPQGKMYWIKRHERRGIPPIYFSYFTS